MTIMAWRFKHCLTLPLACGGYMPSTKPANNEQN
jgi:hypothetical protein